MPGTQAKLIAPEGRSILDGLEVKVAFGDVWKESLGELSGGQRFAHILFLLANPLHKGMAKLEICVSPSNISLAQAFLDLHHIPPNDIS